MIPSEKQQAVSGLSPFIEPRILHFLLCNIADNGDGMRE